MYELAALTVLALVWRVEGKSQSAVKQTSQGQILFLVGAGLLLIFLLVDKWNHHRYSRAIRGTIGDLIYQFRSKRAHRGELRQKIDTDEPQTPKNQGFDHQKTYITAFPETAAHTQATAASLQQEYVLPEQIETQNKNVDFKEVFAIKQSKSKHKVNKKSKSKLKNRLIGKGSDEQREDNSFMGNELIQQNSIQNDKTENEEEMRGNEM